MGKRTRGPYSSPFPRLLGGALLLAVLAHQRAEAQSSDRLNRVLLVGRGERIDTTGLRRVAAGDSTTMDANSAHFEGGAGRSLVVLTAASSLTPPWVQPSPRRSGSRSYTLLGAAIGLGVGAIGTYHLFHAGGSTGRCDQRANQDAIDFKYCVGIYSLGGLAGAGLGALVGSWFRSESSPSEPRGRVSVGVMTPERMTLNVAIAF